MATLNSSSSESLLGRPPLPKTKKSSSAKRIPSREQEIGRLRARLERLHTPRLDMALIVGLAAGAAFITSFLLFHFGMLHMGWRPVSARGVRRITVVRLTARELSV